MTRLNFPRWAGVTAAAVLAMTIGNAATALAQPKHPFLYTACKDPAQNGLYANAAMCTPVMNLPIIAPVEIALGIPSGTDTVTYTPDGLLVVDAAAVGAWWADALGTMTNFSSDSRVKVRASVGNNGHLNGGAGGACPDGTSDFCVTGSISDNSGNAYSGILLKGTVQHFGFQQDAFAVNGGISDDFEFHISLTGGPLATVIMNALGTSDFALEAAGFTGLFPDGSGSRIYPGTNPFGAGVPVVEYLYAFGYSGGTMTTGALFVQEKCNGQISGTVTDYFFGTGIDGVEVSITGQPNAPTSGASGAYSSGAALCQGAYTVTALNPGAYTFNGPDSFVVQISMDPGTGDDSVVGNVNFKMYASAVNATAFTTYNQASWGTSPRGNNTGKLLQTYFPYLYPTGVVVGSTFTLTETTSQYVADILPQEGRPVPLAANFADNAGLLLPNNKGKLKHHRKIGSLAGEVLALQFNVDFSAMSLTKKGLGDLKVASGPLAGKTVSQVLAYGNQMLGGTLAPATIGLKNFDALEDIIEHINKNFQAGTTDNHFLIP